MDPKILESGLTKLFEGGMALGAGKFVVELGLDVLKDVVKKKLEHRLEGLVEKGTESLEKRPGFSLLKKFIGTDPKPANETVFKVTKITVDKNTGEMSLSLSNNNAPVSAPATAPKNDGKGLTAPEFSQFPKLPVANEEAHPVAKSPRHGRAHHNKVA